MHGSLLIASLVQCRNFPIQTRNLFLIYHRRLNLWRTYRKDWTQKLLELSQKTNSLEMEWTRRITCALPVKRDIQRETFNHSRWAGLLQQDHNQGTKTPHWPGTDYEKGSSLDGKNKSKIASGMDILQTATEFSHHSMGCSLCNRRRSLSQQEPHLGQDASHSPNPTHFSNQAPDCPES